MPFLADNKWTVVYLRDRYFVRYCLPSTACHSLPYLLNTTWNIICMAMTPNSTSISHVTSLVAQTLGSATRQTMHNRHQALDDEPSNTAEWDETKTETIVFYAPIAKVPPGITGVDVCGCRITPQPTVRDTGILLDSGMDMTMQITHTCQAAYFQLHNIANIRHCLTIAACKTIVHGLVTSKLDYGNAVLFGINGRLLQKLQRVQNSARVITYQWRRDISTSRLC